ncbi:MAG TPA: hypothetical protein VKN16_21340 [Methylomirabilota bacterium]|jgi:hypothetical protein|nr:hypothetical protein [Methylomirabilota bacterium]
MAFTHTIRTIFSSAGGASVQGSVASVADAEDNRDIVVPPTTTDHPVALTLAFASLKSLFILSDQDVSFQTNNAATPVDTLTLKANVPFTWVSTGGVVNPFTANITSLFLTNAGATAATVQIRLAVDSTP